MSSDALHTLVFLCEVIGNVLISQLHCNDSFNGKISIRYSFIFRVGWIMLKKLPIILHVFPKLPYYS